MSSRGRLEDIYPFIRYRNKEGSYENVIEPVILNLLHEAAREEFGKGSYEKALSIISRVDPEKRTPATHDVIAETLSRLRPSSFPVILDTTLRRTIFLYAEKDEAIRRELLRYMDSQILYFTEQGNFERVEELLADLPLLRNDPDRANDRLRAEYALSLYRSRQFQQGGEALAEIRTGIPLALRLRLWINGPFVRDGTLLLYLIFGALILAFIYLKRRSRPSQARHGGGETGDDSGSGFSFIHSVTAGLNPGLQEYNRCLAVLGLSPGADMKDIKTAYRQALKENHPDAKRNKDLKASAAFMEVTDAYETIIKLDRKFGFASLNKTTKNSPETGV